MRLAFLLALILSLPLPLHAAYDLAGWEEDATTLGYQVEAFDKCRGRMAEKPRFKGCLMMWDDARKRVARMQGFAKSAPDPFRTARLDKQVEQFEAASAFLAPEVRALSKDAYARLMANDKQLAPMKRDIEALRKPAPKS